MNREVWWSSVDETGLEHLKIRRDEANIVAESVILRVEDGAPFHFFYRLFLDSAWRVREIEIERRNRPERRIRLFADGAGNWRDAATGNDLPELAGCFDIDISATPFTNTLPVKRNELKTGEAVDISVVYFRLPEMKVERSEQRYTALENNIYRFEENGLFAGFSADIKFDGNGLVIDYPNLFRRIKIPFKGEIR